jgi:hypothetical protein
MREFVTFCWIVTVLAACMAGFQLLFTMTSAQSAPQQAAGAALAAATVIVPYVFTRAMEGFAPRPVVVVTPESAKVPQAAAPATQPA